jgi:hypothetical protein
MATEPVAASLLCTKLGMHLIPKQALVYEGLYEGARSVWVHF